jgi:NitT/TauT family transport system substrate-binding protein
MANVALSQRAMSAAATALVLALTTAIPAFSAELIPASIRFSWKLKGEYAPFYAALEQGYYKEEGINMTLGEGAGAQAALAAVEQDRDTLTYAPGIFGLQAVSKGLSVRLVTLYHPAAPMVFISHPEKPVRKPKDLEGMKLGTSVGDTAGDFLQVFCNINGIDCSKIQTVSLSIPALIPAFVAKTIDVTSAYLTNDIPNMKDKGMNFVMLNIPEFGLKVPGGALIAGEKTIRERPDLLRKIVAATNRGYEFSAREPLKAAQMLRKYWSTAPADKVVVDQINETTAIVPRYEGRPMGWIDTRLLQDALQQTKMAGKIDAVLPLEKYYTNDLNTTK